MNVTILGTGYVGLTTGACLAYLGHQVTCVDSDQSKIDSLLGGKMPFYEPHLADLIADAQENLRFTTAYTEAIPAAQVIFIAVGTPPGAGGGPDLRYLEAAARGIGENLGQHFTVIVNKSTVPIGSGNWVDSLVRDAFQKRNVEKNGDGFAVASNPEFLREGSALHDSLYPDRVVVGADEPRTAEVLYTLYRPILEQTFSSPTYLPRPEDLEAAPLISTDLASAELIKYAANAFLSLKISYINEVGQLAEKVGADILHIAKGIGLDARIGTRFLQAGIGWGGSCFGKDTAALVATAAEYGLEMPIVKAAREINRRQRERVVDRLLGELKILKGRTIGLLGLAFKPNTDDLRDAPALDVAQRLLERGARVKAHDPVAMPRFRQDNPTSEVVCCETPEDVANGSDALVLITEWPQYRDLNWETVAASMRSAILLDGRNALDRGRLKKGRFPICRARWLTSWVTRQGSHVLNHLRQILEDEEKPGRLDRAALDLASIQFPGLEPEPFLDQLNDLASRLGDRLRNFNDGRDFVETAQRYLFGELGFHGYDNEQEYYDPRNSCLNHVLEQRTGLPITLSVMYMEIARRLQMPVFGIGLPRHFVIQFDDGNYSTFIDPFHQGRLITARDCFTLADAPADPSLLRRVSQKQIVMRLLQNMHRVYRRTRDFERALTTLDLMISGAPDTAVWYKHRAGLSAEVQRWRAARSDLEKYLAMEPEAPDREEVLKSIQSIKVRAAQLN